MRGNLQSPVLRGLGASNGARLLDHLEALKALAGPSANLSVVKIGRAFVLLDDISAVDDDHLAGDVGCGFASEERDSRGDFVRTAGAADRRIPYQR